MLPSKWAIPYKLCPPTPRKVNKIAPAPQLLLKVTPRKMNKIAPQLMLKVTQRKMNKIAPPTVAESDTKDEESNDVFYPKCYKRCKWKQSAQQKPSMLHVLLWRIKNKDIKTPASMSQQ